MSSDGHFLEPEMALARIESLVLRARTIWLSLIGFLAFVGLTLFSVKDVDFFSIDSSTTLPFVYIAIPTTTFFWTATWLAAILHTYFHLFLLKLWDALAEAPPEIEGQKLGDRVIPWLVVDWALRQRPDAAVTRRPLDGLGTAVIGLTIWLAAPLALAGFWWRSMPAHIAWLTLLIALALGLSLFVSLQSWHRARRRLHRPGAPPDHANNPSLFARALAETGRSLTHYGWAVVAGVLVSISMAGTGTHNLPRGADDVFASLWPESWPAVPWTSANLIEAQIARRPADWREHAVARRQYHIGWCRDHGIPPLACEANGEADHARARQRWCQETEIADCDARFQTIDAAFAADWQIERRAYLANITGPDLSNRDLSHSVTNNAFVVGVDLRGAQLDWANLSEAQLDGADLSEAQLEGADLRGAQLDRADLRGAQLDRADLRGAQLDRADLSWAQLDGADLSKAQLEVANLSWAQLDGADLSEAQLDRAILWEAQLDEADLSWAQLDRADLRGAQLDEADLSWAQLEGAILREAQLEGAQLEGANLSWAHLDGANLSEAQLDRANLSWADLDGANLSEAQLEGANLSEAHLDWANLSEAQLEGANLREAQLDGANLWGAQLKGANLIWAQLEGADLSGAQLEGANLSGAQLKSARWAGANFGPSPAQQADFRFARDLSQDQLQQVIGDEATRLPMDNFGNRLFVWSCWTEESATRFVELWVKRIDDIDAQIRELGWVCPPGQVPQPVQAKPVNGQRSTR